MRHQHHTHRRGEHQQHQEQWGQHGQHGFWWGGMGMHHGAFGRGRWHGHGRGRGWDLGDFFNEGRGGGWGGPNPRERLERGMLRYVILSVLQDGPRHGYDIMKYVEDRTNGRHSPSPGALYPTLQYLEDMDLIRSEQQGDKRVYQLTDSGRAELDKQQSTMEGFWSRFNDDMPMGPSMHEVKFAADAMKDLLRTLADGLRTGAYTRDPDTVRRIRESLERSQNEVREIIAQSWASNTAPSQDANPQASGGEPTRRTGPKEDVV